MWYGQGGEVAGGGTTDRLLLLSFVFKMRTLSYKYSNDVFVGLASPL